MNNPPRAVACDLDGTLLRSDLSVSERSRAALAAVEAAGALLVFVTGRPPRWMAPVTDQVDHRGLAICANGALVYDLHTNEVVESDLIAPDVLARIVAELGQMVDGLAFAIEHGEGFWHDANYPVAAAHRTSFVREVGPEELVGVPVAKLLVRHPEQNSAALMAAVGAVFDGLAEVTHSTPVGPGLLELSAAGVSKASALARLCAAHGIGAADVVAFGDMPNDLPMLAWAGRPYAMANAHPDVLAAIAGRAPSNDEDGVAVVLEQFFGAAAHPHPRRG
jgi:Cof subfamily protein (haloacid dehalogenase superfamily)